jgi:hypothetical protein
METLGDYQMTNRRLSFLSGTLIALLAPTANAIEVQSGVGVFTTFRDCVPNNSTCDFLGQIALGTHSPEPGELSAVALQVLPDFGESFAAIALSGEIGAPIIKTRVTSELGKRNSTNTVAVQRYVYQGNEPVTRTFGGRLTYAMTVENPQDAGTSGRTVINATIRVFKMDAEFVDAGDTAISSFNALFNLPFSQQPGYELLAVQQYVGATTDPAGDATLEATVNLEPGDAVWVHVLMQTPAAMGSVVDASRTLVTRWDEPADLVPATISLGIPEQLLESLLESSTGVGPGKSLASKVAAAQAYYAANDIPSTCLTLDDYQNQVRAVSGRRLDPVLATELSATAQLAQLSMGCE